MPYESSFYNTLTFGAWEDIILLQLTKFSLFGELGWTLISTIDKFDGVSVDKQTMEL